MRNLRKTCLALSVVSALGISANAATLTEALSGGKVSGEIRNITVMGSYTDNRTSGPYNNANSSAIALQLKYSTADYNGFKANIGFQTSHSLELEDKESQSGSNGAGAGFSNENEPRITQEGSNLHIANLQYNTGNTEVKVGRQGVSTTLMSLSNVNPLVDTYNGLSIVNKDIANTEIQFYALKDWIERYSTTDSSRIIHWKKPTLSLYVKNSSIKGLTLDGQILAVRDSVGNPTDAPTATKDSYKTYFGQFDYKLPVGMPLSIGAFYAVGDYDDTTAQAPGRKYLKEDNDTNMMGIKLSGKIANTPFKLAYTKVGDDGDFIGNLGHTPCFFKYNGGQMFTGNTFAGVSTVSAMVIPKIIPGVFSLFTVSKYSQTDKGIANTTTGNNLDGALEIQADLRYKFSKNFSGRLQVAQVDYNGHTAASGSDDKMTIGKMYLTYKF